jgi:glycosyltransferase involved in cell wall biosynthesis
MVGLPVAAARRRLDVIHSPANVGPLVTFRTAKVVTLLDVIWLHEREQVGHAGWSLTTMRLQSLASSRRADRVLAISEWAKQDLVAAAGLAPGRIDVTPLGVRPAGDAATEEADLRARYSLGSGPIVLSVAQKRPYKNLDTLLRALPELDPDVRLVLPGASTPHENELRSLARQLGVTERVRFLAWVSDSDLAGLYRAATCFALPSRMEGFGLPILEAMAAGTPVACADRASLPEVAGDAALLFNPDDQRSVTGALRRLLDDPPLRADFVRRGRARVREFTWERTATATLAAYRRAMDSRSST